MDASEPLVHLSRPGTVETNAPAVVLIHGRGTNERDLLSIVAQLPEELHVLSVRAPKPMNGDSYTWYELDLSAGGLEVSQPDSEDFRRSLELLSEFVEEAIERYDLDPDRIGLFGFSQGAIASVSALLERPDAYRWVVALSGYLPRSHEDDVENAAGKPVFVGGGSRDRIIPPERTKRVAELLEDGGAAVRFETYDGGHGIAPRELSDVLAWLEGRY